MTEWRFGRGWTEEELKSRLALLKDRATNFPLSGPESQEGTNWRRYYSESVIGYEGKGPPEANGPFAIGKKAISEYQFSDPGIVTGHFNPQDPLQGRPMLLEIKIVGLHYLCAARVSDVRENTSTDKTEFAFRYDTLEGHMEVGSEWFSLTKKHETGEIIFRISASWRPGKFPNWWSKLGFHLVSRRYQLAWHRLAYLRLRELVGSGGRDLVPVPYGEELVHTGADISDSKLWVLKQPSATGRVLQMSGEREASAAGPSSNEEPDKESEIH